MRLPRLPGFVEHRGEGNAAVLIVAEAWSDAVLAAGLHLLETWQALLREPWSAAGRGASARVELTSEMALRLKALRRGGWAGRLWRDRHRGVERLLDNLRLPAGCIERGLATPEAVALLIEPAGRGLYRGWLATRELEGAIDLAAWLGRGNDDPQGLEAAMSVVRQMHDLGFEHADHHLSGQ